MRPFSTRITRVLPACLAALIACGVSLSAQASEPVVGADGVLLRGCGRDCPSVNFDGTPVPTVGEGVVASPLGTTYSVNHRLGATISGAPTCFFNLASMTGDDIVTFDGIAETTRTHANGVVPVVNELHQYQVDGTRYLRINTSSQNGADLFPSGVQSGGTPLTHACFTLGLQDPLDWEGIDNVTTAVITFYKDGAAIVGPTDIAPLFSDPWDGMVEVVLPNGAGLGIDAVQLEIRVFKNVQVPNDDCINRIPVTDGTYAFSTEGATTDGVPHPQQCALGTGVPDIGQDIWFAYTATCNGELTVDLCDSQYDTKVAVYNGCGRCPPTEDPIACNDDFCFLRSFLPDPNGGGVVPVALGSCYTIRVGGFQAAQGQGVLRLQCNEVAAQGACCAGGTCDSPTEEPDCVSQGGDWYEGEDCDTFDCPIIIPSHDECSNCITLQTGVPFIGSTVNATGEDISSCTVSDANDVWHCWTADCSGLVTFETCSGPDPSFDTSLSIFDGCTGQQLACQDDGCGVQSRLQNMVVSQGTTYYLRVAGYSGTTGQYRILINPCRSACCTSAGQCFAVTHDQCLAGNGFPQLPGTLCLGDTDQNSIDDACELCPGPPNGPTMTGIDPPNNALDARQPHPPTSAATRQGWGTATEPVRVSVLPQLAELENCFALCETQDDPVHGANGISAITYQGGGIYRIVLDQAISAGAAATFQYLGNQSFRTLINHPGNVDGNTVANAADIQKLLACCLGEGACSPALPASQVTFRCDIDRSGSTNSLDLLRLVDLLVGSEDYAIWNNTVRPSATGICP